MNSISKDEKKLFRLHLMSEIFKRKDCWRLSDLRREVVAVYNIKFMRAYQIIVEYRKDGFLEFQKDKNGKVFVFSKINQEVWSKINKDLGDSKIENLFKNFSVEKRKIPAQVVLWSELSRAVQEQLLYKRISSKFKKCDISCLMLEFLKFIEFYQNNGFRCHYCKIPMCRQGNKKSSLSIDRKDSTKGYSFENIVLACFRCNVTKFDNFSEEEMLKIAEVISTF